MFLHEIYSSDSRFKSLRFHPGLNLLIAERTDASDQGDSRNGTGKSSFVRLLRFILGGNLPDALKSPMLRDHAFSAKIAVQGGDPEYVTRFVSPTTRVLHRDSSTSSPREIHVNQWREDLGARAFGLELSWSRPTLGQLLGQLIRTEFNSPVKTFPAEADWESGVRVGYLLGMDPQVLAAGGNVLRREKQLNALKSAIKEGAVAHLELDEATIRSELASARNLRDRTRAELQGFRVEELYADHQRRADDLSGEIRDLNEQALLLERRARELREAAGADAYPGEHQSSELLERMYSEIGIHLPSAVVRRFDEVARFHDSIVANRLRYLADEAERTQKTLSEVKRKREELDFERGELMRLLSETVALESFLEAQRAVAELDGVVAELSRRLESAESLNDIDAKLKSETASAISSVRNELLETAVNLDEPISLFTQLGAEIYRDHKASLLVSVGQKAALKIVPRIEGDASDGIKGVATFLLDMVTMVAGLKSGRAPGLLVHDSHLFDAVDHRQVASCLNIGARLADKHGFQYIVTMNSDFLASVESEGAFERGDYVLPVTLKDEDELGGLFGFRFDSELSGASSGADQRELTDA